MLPWMFISSLLYCGVGLIKEGIESCMPAEEVQPKVNLAYRDEHGNVIIQNEKLFKEDEEKYGYIQAYKWVETGRYNMSKEDYEKQQAYNREHYFDKFKNPFIPQ